jgi:Ca2+-binding EF-hand superfamily protein
LSEVVTGLKAVLRLEAVYKAKPVIIRAFNAARTGDGTQTGANRDYIEYRDFRPLLYYLRKYQEYWTMFKRLDTDTDQRVSFEEFRDKLAEIKGWGAQIEDARAAFAEIDANGKGMVLFDEFSNWAIRKDLDLEDDDDDDFDPSIQLQEQPLASNRNFLKEFKQNEREKNRQAKKESKKGVARAGFNEDQRIWAQLAEKLPWHNTKEDKAKRKKLWHYFDVNGNGHVSLSEVDFGIRLICGAGSLYKAKPVLLRAFNAAKNIGGKQTGKNAEYIERREFRYLLLYLRKYYEYWVMFNRIDTSGDRRLSHDEFIEGISQIESWGVSLEDSSAAFHEMDSDGRGMILFDEFCNWAIHMHLDLEDDDDDDEDDTIQLQEQKRFSVEETLAAYQESVQKPTAAEHKVDRAGFSEDKRIWELLAKKLPWHDTKEDKQERKRLWHYFDVNGNGFVSLAEVDLGVKMVCGASNLFQAKPVLLRAFNAAKNRSGTQTGKAADYIERNEFRLLLLYLRKYYEYWTMFNRIDVSGDRRISKDEFMAAIGSLKDWGVTIEDSSAAFDEMDSDGHGMILFDEFCNWAINMHLDLQDDDDDDGDGTELKAQALYGSDSARDRPHLETKHSGPSATASAASNATPASTATPRPVSATSTSAAASVPTAPTHKKRDEMTTLRVELKMQQMQIKEVMTALLAAQADAARERAEAHRLAESNASLVQQLTQLTQVLKEHMSTQRGTPVAASAVAPEEQSASAAATSTPSDAPSRTEEGLHVEDVIPASTESKTAFIPEAKAMVIDAGSNGSTPAQDSMPEASNNTEPPLETDEPEAHTPPTPSVLDNIADLKAHLAAISQQPNGRLDDDNSSTTD